MAVEQRGRHRPLLGEEPSTMSQMQEAERLLLQFQGLFGKPDGKAEDHAGGAGEDTGGAAKAEDRPLARLRLPATPAQAMMLPSTSSHIEASLQAAPPAPRPDPAFSAVHEAQRLSGMSTAAKAAPPAPRPDPASSGVQEAHRLHGISTASKDVPITEEPGTAAAPATQECPEDIYHGKAPDTLVFRGGSSGWAAEVGITRRMEEAKLISKVSTFIGTSGGAQVAALLAFRYTSEELEEVARKAPPRRKLLDDAGFPCGAFRNVIRLFGHFGVCKGNALEGYLDGLFQRKYGRRGCTFRQLYALTGKELRLGVCNLVTRQFEFLDRRSHPDMPVCAAVRASSSLPLLFRPVRYGKGLYVDGGLEAQLPISHLRHGKQVLAFNLLETASSDKKPPANFIQFVGLTVHMLKESSQHFAGNHSERMLRNDGIDVLNIDIGKARSFDGDLSPADFDKLVKCGYSEVARYFRPSTE